MRYVVSLCFCLMVSFWSNATETNHLDVLKESKWFTISGGLGNGVTAEAKAVGAICNQPNSVAQFCELLKAKEPVPQLYGLLGLQLTNAQEFKDALPDFLASEKKARVLVGCIGGEMDVREIARQIREKQWHLRTVPVPGGKYEAHVEPR